MLMSLEFIADALDSEGTPDFKNDLDRYDLNSDGEITADDNPFMPGSPEAKLWWRNILEPYAQSQITPELQDQYGDRIVGVYKGKPLVPGEAGAGQGDFAFLVDKIRVTKGLEYLSAVKIAGKIKALKYGG
jgi:hypothetical protein